MKRFSVKRVKIPTLRLHKPSGRAFVEIDGHRHYLGAYDDPSIGQQYHRFLGELDGKQVPVNPTEITIAELAALYLDHATARYVHEDGKATSEMALIAAALKPLNAMYGDILAAMFSQNKLRAVRQTWIDAKLTRATINHYAGIIRHIFKWGAGRELIPATVHHALQTVENIDSRNRDVRQTTPVTPAPDAHIDAIKPLVSRQVWALISLQRIMGARSGELLTLRPMDIDTTGKTWTAVLKHHKTVHLGKARTLYFGERCQNILKPFLLRAPDAFLFSPIEAERERWAACPKHRHQPAGQRRTDRELGDHYTTSSYRRAIARACDLWREFADLARKKNRSVSEDNRHMRVAGILGVDVDHVPKPEEVPNWHPHQLRHNAATMIRAEFGPEAAQAVLGHSSIKTTEIYALVSREKAITVAEKIG